MSPDPSDVEAVAEMFGNGAIGVLGELVSLLVISATMMLVDWRLGLLLLLTLIPVMRIVIALQTRYRHANSRAGGVGQPQHGSSGKSPRAGGGADVPPPIPQ